MFWFVSVFVFEDLILKHYSSASITSSLDLPVHCTCIQRIFDSLGADGWSEGHRGHCN